MRSTVAVLSLLLVADASAAQVAPFDMSPERATLPALEKTEPVAFRPRQPDAPAARRHLLALTDPRLVGEQATRSWSVYLTAAETAGATLDLGFASSIFVAPEASRLRLAINGTPVLDTPIRAAGAPAALSAPLPPGVLRPGPNVFALEVQQRHRTDCTVSSTYDLWTELDPARTFLSFADPAAVAARELRDVLATGVDAARATRIAILVPESGDPSVTAEAMRLAQILASAIGAPQPVVSLHKAKDADFAAAGLKVALGTASALAGELAAPVGASEPGFSALPELGPVLVVGAPTTGTLAGAVDRLAADLAPAAAETDVVRTAAWQLPDAPLAEGARRLDFAGLGVPSQEFTGRRASVGFQVALPADFYAQGYGEAELVLDAAYAPDMLPGSRIDVLVNGNLASTMPLGERGGGILRGVPLDVTMRHFRPGVNEIRLDALLETAADASCAPGTPAGSTPRFALFDTSSFVVPRFARRGQLPNLAAMTGRGFPYADAGGPVTLVLGDGADATRSAAATLLAKLAQTSGRVLPVELAMAGALPRNAIFVGAVNQLPETVLESVAVDAAARTSWSGIALDKRGDAAPPAEPLSLDGWRTSITEGTWQQPINAAAAFLRSNAPRMPGWQDEPYRPGPDTTLVLAQGVADGGGTWTLLTAPTPDMLADGTAVLVRQETWGGIGGRLAALQQDSDVPFVVSATETVLVATQPWSFANARLVAANWMSGNIVAFSLALSFACLLLGVATRTMLANLGRRR